MKTITIDEELYAFIASQTKHIGESASDILRRILIDELGLVAGEDPRVDVTKPKQVTKAVREINKAKNQSQQSAHKPVDGVVDAADLFNLLSADKFKQAMSKVERFLLMLSALHHAHPIHFDAVLNIKGKGRLYFAQSKDELLQSGSSTNPKQIPDSEFWVVTNNNTAKKRTMLLNAADALGYSKSSMDRLVKMFDAE
ncbi:replication initiation negative regulator SeqA [Aliiglaciecola sp. LCG003]|uniref:replication initiation negative regulator SeqA n=1 Tax=Aliiglaciecola sp. LCG003 TaxID=3053655 RepID=UPI002572CA35|nr:replication initiation negative regulator SeqA [Aliiglaciecola sp. LCG003]WJG08236.1 replication initiation negative regulator SeqA [Aliiglaciecola sp. LCG003]